MGLIYSGTSLTKNIKGTPSPGDQEPPSAVTTWLPQVISPSTGFRPGVDQQASMLKPVGEPVALNAGEFDEAESCERAGHAAFQEVVHGAFDGLADLFLFRGRHGVPSLLVSMMLWMSFPIAVLRW